MKRHDSLGDLIGDLEAGHAEFLNEMRSLALRLGFLARASIVTANVIADAHAREQRSLLTKLLNAENSPRSRRRKAPKGDADARRTR
jgi:hypothetical protein